MKKTLVAILASAALVAGCANARREEQIQTALDLSKEHFRRTAQTQDDALETTATISTVAGVQERRGLLGLVWDDNFLRGFIDKKTGKTTFQLYQIIYYRSRSWNFYQTANYETPNGPESHPVTVISRDVDCTGLRYEGCMYIEHIGVTVDEKVLRAIAAGYVPGQRNVWKFKFGAKSGAEYNDGMLPAEVAGCLEAVDDYLASRGLRATQSDAAGAAAPVSVAIARAPNAEAPAAPAAANPLAAGKDAYQAEHLQAARTCNAQPRAVLSAKGAGFETYTVNCTNGDALTVRCEFGNCRVLR